MARYARHFNIDDPIPPLGEDALKNFAAFKETVGESLRITGGSRLQSAYRLGVLLPTMTMMHESPGDNAVILNTLRESLDQLLAELPEMKPLSDDTAQFRTNPTPSALSHNDFGVTSRA